MGTGPFLILALLFSALPHCLSTPLWLRYLSHKMSSDGRQPNQILITHGLTNDELSMAGAELKLPTLRFSVLNNVLGDDFGAWSLLIVLREAGGGNSSFPTQLRKLKPSRVYLIGSGGRYFEESQHEYVTLSNSGML